MINRNELKTIGKIGLASLIGFLSLNGCKYSKPVEYSKNSNFCGFRIKAGIKDNIRFVNIYENFRNTRGYKPASLQAKDIDPDTYGFENIRLVLEYDIITGVDSLSIKNLEKFNNPEELERIWAYSNARILWK